MRRHGPSQLDLPSPRALWHPRQSCTPTKTRWSARSFGCASADSPRPHPESLKLHGLEYAQRFPRLPLFLRAGGWASACPTKSLPALTALVASSRCTSLMYTPRPAPQRLWLRPRPAHHTHACPTPPAAGGMCTPEPAPPRTWLRINLPHHKPACPTAPVANGVSDPHSAARR